MQREESAASAAQKKKNWTLGIIYLGISTLLWGCASVLQKFIYNKEGLNSPFFLTYITTSIFILFLPIHEFSVRMRYCKRARYVISDVGLILIDNV